MTFADDDLKRLKEATTDPLLTSKTILLDLSAIKALLARLEAAEAYINEHEVFTMCCDFYDKWKKVAGK